MKIIKFIGIVLIIAFVYFNDASYVDMSKYESDEIEIEVKGEVHSPGVYKLKNKQTIQDAIDKANGINDVADISSLNLTKKLKQGDVIVIGKISEKKKVSLNSATIEELQTLPGVGPSTAQKIIDFRNEGNQFQTIEDIMLIKGIKEKLFGKIKEYITL